MLSPKTLSDIIKTKLNMAKQNARVFNTDTNLSILPKKIRAGEWGC